MHLIKKRAPRRAARGATLFAAIALVLGLAGCPAPGAFPPSAYLESLSVPATDFSALPDGSYSGSKRIAVPEGGVAAFPYAELEFTISGGRIEGLRLNAPQVMAQNPEFPAFALRIEAAQSLGVDGVSGCSYTSAAMSLAIAGAARR
jgi:uncharacterized protein with FMN-binding domain